MRLWRYPMNLFKQFVIAIKATKPNNMGLKALS